MSNPLDRLKKAAKKGFKEIKKGIGSIANKAADKLVPKELAPFLPLLSFVPGLNLGLGSLFGLGQTASTYLIPQLLTALSTGKSQGDIDLGAQAVTAAGSFLSDPNRFDFGTKVTGGDPVFTDPTIDPGYVTGGKTVPMEFADIADPTFSDRLKNIGNVSRDFFQGDLPAFDKFRRPILDPETGLQLAVKDASFAANVPRLATSIGIGSVPGAMSYIARKTQEAEEEEAKREAEREEMLAARGALSDYFFNLSDPTNRFRDFRIFSAEGGPVSGITDMINQNIDQMQDNLSQQIQGGFTTQETIVPVDEAPASTMTQPQGIQAMSNFDLFRQRMNQMRSRLQQPGAQEGPQGGGQALGQAQQAFMPLGGPFGGPSTLAYQRQRQGRSGISSLYGFANGGMATAPGMPQGMQVDGRNGTFIPMGVKEKADDVPAMLSKNEFVMTADAVKAAGGGSVEKGAQRMYDLMNTLEGRV